MADINAAIIYCQEPCVVNEYRCHSHQATVCLIHFVLQMQLTFQYFLWWHFKVAEAFYKYKFYHNNCILL